MAQKTAIKNPPQPYEDPATRRERARFEKMKAEMDEGWKKKMGRDLPTEVMTRPGSKKPLPPMAKRQREKRYSFGALEKDKNLPLEEYRRKAGRDPMGYKERKTREVFAALDAASLAGVPKLVGLGGKAVAGLAGARLAAGQAAKEALKQSGKEAGKQFAKKGTQKVAEKGAKDSARPGKETDIVQRPAPRPLAQASPVPLTDDRLKGALKGPKKKRQTQEEWARERARIARMQELSKRAREFDTRPSA